MGDARAAPLLRAAFPKAGRNARENIVFMLGQLKDRNAVDLLLEALNDDGHMVRYYAAGSLGRIGDPRAVTALMELLKDEKWSIRESAATSLGDIGDPKALTSLLPLLQDKDSSVRYRAAWALGCLKDKQALAPLIRAVKNEDPELREGAAGGLGCLGDPVAVPHLIPLLKDSEPAVRRESADALGSLGDAKAVEHLLKLVDDEDRRVREKAAEAVRKLTGKTVHAMRLAMAEGRPPKAASAPVDKIVRRIDDTIREGVEWLVYEKKFVGRREGRSVVSFEEFLGARGLDSISVNALAFDMEHVWAATDAGAFCYDRQQHTWFEYAVNIEYIGLPVKSVCVEMGSSVVFDMEIDGKDRTFVLDTRSSKWRER
jgi:HEAT repeat protein